MKRYMVTKSIFVDTSWFKAISDKNDDFSNIAVGQHFVFKQQNVLLVTTNFVLDESFTLIRTRVDLQSALDFRQLISAMGRNLKVVRVSPQDEEKAWDWFPNDWSKLSFTDCTSFAVMKRLGLKDVATLDEHFARAGFTIFK